MIKNTSIEFQNYVTDIIAQIDNNDNIDELDLIRREALVRLRENKVNQKEKEIKSRDGALTSLPSFKRSIESKQNFHLTVFFWMVIIIFVNVFLFINVVPEIRSNASVIVLLWLIIITAFYGLFHSVKKMRLYQNVINKLNILILRLELHTDKDLIVPNRLDRELEMIYRILES